MAFKKITNIRGISANYYRIDQTRICRSKYKTKSCNVEVNLYADEATCASGEEPIKNYRHYQLEGENFPSYLSDVSELNEVGVNHISKLYETIKEIEIAEHTADPETGYLWDAENV